MYTAFGISDIGTVRKNNEDVWAEQSENHFYILADGIGGHSAGEVASRESVLHFCDAVDKYFRSPIAPSVSSVKRYLGETFISANSWIRRLGKDHPDLQGMGTTLSCLLFLHHRAIVGHVGDCRVYQFQKEGACHLLTTDHFQHKPIPGHKPGLTRAIGISPAIEPELIELPAAPHDIYLLCSDGLHSALSETHISQMVRSSLPLHDICHELVEAAKQKGSRDNITAVLIKVESEEWWHG